MVLLFSSIALAFGWVIIIQTGLGLCVAGIYLILTLLLSLVKDRFIEGPLLKKFSELFFTTKLWIQKNILRSQKLIGN
jgi:hypothetical protein